MQTAKCAECSETVGDGADCCVCRKTYHFGAGCGGITERGYTRLGTGRATWMCNPCRETSQAGVDEVRVEEAQHHASPQAKFSSGLPLEQRLSASSRTSTPRQSLSVTADKFEQHHITLLNDILSKISDMQGQMSTISLIQQDLLQVKSDISDVKATLNTRLDNLSTRVDEIESRVAAVELLRNDMEDLKAQIETLQDEGHKNDQWVRRSNIQINGVPQKVGENLIKIVKTIADRSGYPLNPDSDIDFVTRVAVKNDTEGTKCKPIILKLQSRYKKDDFLAALRKLKDFKANDIGFLGMTSRIYFNDHLSSRNKKLLHQAKIRAKENNYAFCWVRNCTIMVRKCDKSPVINITSGESLKKII